VGIVPADKPRLVIAVMIDEPQPAHYGGLVSGPAFKEIAEEALRYLSVPPTTPIAVKKDKDKKERRPVPKLADDETEGQPAVLGQLPVVGELEPDEDDGRELVTVPSFAGMTMGQVIRAARRAGVELEVEGSGLAVGQSPPAGALPRGSVCRVSFRPGG
jgi:cell division protein FtsI (penicillin-binding protein 3)